MSGPIQTNVETLRVRAGELFDAMEWPTPSEEEWRRTDLGRFPFDDYQVDDERSASTTILEDWSGRDLFPESEFAAAARFEAGVCVGASGLDSLGESGAILALSNEDVRDLGDELPGPGANAFEKMLETTLGRIDNRVEAWHYRGELHGAVLYVPAGVEIATPVLLDFSEKGQMALTAPHVFVILESGASVQLIVSLTTSESDRLLCNSGIHASVAEGARLELLVIDDLGSETTHFAHRRATVDRDARFTQFEAHLGGSLVKSRSEAELAGAGSEAYLNGVFFGDNGAHLDIRSVQTHLAPHTTSRSLYKGVVAGSARTIYQGLIEIDEEATQADAYLTNNNLVLDDGARSDSIPSLKIRTNEVKCSHGSTTGRIDQAALFYLMSRGFTRDAAQSTIIEGYFEDVAKRGGPLAIASVMGAITRRLAGRAA